MLFFRLCNLTVTSPTTKVAELLSLRGSSSLCAAVTQCLCLPVLATSHIYISDTIWSQFQAIKSAQHRHECCGPGTAFSPFGDITPVGDLEVKISNQLQLCLGQRMSRRDGWPSHSKVQSYLQVSNFHPSTHITLFFVLGIVSEIPIQNLTNYCQVSFWKISLNKQNKLCCVLCLPLFFVAKLAKFVPLNCKVSM